MVVSPLVGRRRRLGVLPTPLVRAGRLNRERGGGDVWVKRDDLIGFAQAGTKTRPLEFLVADAVDAGADCLVWCGGAGSNFTAVKPWATIAAAVSAAASGSA